MTLRLPPPPIQEDTFTNNWKVWFLKVKEQLSSLSSIAWSLLDFTGSNLSDIITRNHNDLQNKQGGTTNEYYHLSLANHGALTGGGVTNLHHHGGINTTITTAKITAGGNNGSMTFTNGVLTAHTQAT